MLSYLTLKSKFKPVFYQPSTGSKNHSMPFENGAVIGQIRATPLAIRVYQRTEQSFQRLDREIRTVEDLELAHRSRVDHPVIESWTPPDSKTISPPHAEERYHVLRFVDIFQHKVAVLPNSSSSRPRAHLNRIVWNVPSSRLSAWAEFCHIAKIDAQRLVF